MSADHNNKFNFY